MHVIFNTKAHVSWFYSQQAGLELLTRLYVGRSYHVWKVPEILPWLERNCRVVLDRVDGGDAAVKLAAEKRKLRYQGPTRSEGRRVGKECTARC